MGPDGKHLNFYLTLSGAERDQAMIYVFSISYLYVFQGRRSSLVANHFQLLAEDSKPTPRSQRCQAFASATGVHRVKMLPVFVNTLHRHHRFTALSGMYFSLQYLSYSDAVLLRYIAPILTGFSGAIFLKERLFLKQFVAGCKYFVIELASTAILQDTSV